MLTPFGKALRVFRVNNSELLKEMADRLGVTPAYLSAVENGKKDPTDELMARLYKAYRFTPSEKEELEEARAKTQRFIKLSFDNDEDGDLGLLFARSLGSLSDTQRLDIRQILDQLNRK